MKTYDDFVEALKIGAKDMANEIFDGFENEAKDDVEAFLERTKNDMKRWTNLLAKGELTQHDFSDLVQAKKALAEIHSLRQIGVTLTKLERFRTGLINLIIDKALTFFL
ncbi:MAG: hypothetical protein JW866_01380 [Ignavibacteriales bacterium]|nr:hypothetical protein [Ignavibacteriales bacterium]